MNIKGILMKTETLELRGVSNGTSKDGEVYYYINTEREDGTAKRYYTKDSSVFEQGLKKGDKVEVWCDQTEYKNEIKLRVVKVHKVA